MIVERLVISCFLGVKVTGEISVLGHACTLCSVYLLEPHVCRVPATLTIVSHPDLAKYSSTGNVWNHIFGGVKFTYE